LKVAGFARSTFNRGKRNLDGQALPEGCDSK
jgi:hypothetical protein